MNNFLSNPNIRRGLAVLTTAGAMYAGSIACSGDQPSGAKCNPYIDKDCTVELPDKRDTNLGITTSSVPKTTSTTLSPEQAMANEQAARREAADKYAKSTERNDRINAVVQEVGHNFVVACQTGVAGPCDVYNSGADQWRSQSASTKEGWVWMQHNPQYGGKDMQFSATVWANSDWTIDESKGIKGIRFNDANGSFGFTAPGGDPGLGGVNKVHENSWETESKPWDQEHVDIASEFSTYDKSATDLQIVDLGTISLAKNFQDMHGLKPA